MRGRNPSQGFTLLELLLAVAVLITLASLSSLAFSDLSARLRAKSTAASLMEFIALARNHALFRQQIITLCPLDMQYRCSREWGGQLVQFSDPNANARVDPGETILQRWEADSGESLSWRNNGRYLRFRPNGSTTALTGSLKYCARHKPVHNSFRIVVARTGRARIDWSYADCMAGF